MPHPSNALGDFISSLAAAERLARIEQRYRDPPHPATAPTVEALRGGCCVLYVGSFERFLTEAFEEHLGALVGTPPPVAFAALPRKLFESSIFESLEFATRGPRHGAVGGRHARVPDVLAAARRIVAENIDPHALSQTKGNPDADRVNEMFRALGMTDALNDVRPRFDAMWTKPEASTFVRDKLDEIVNARHVVAHTASALSISRLNLQEWPRFLRVVAQVLDERLDRYVANVITGHTPA